jgi:hypothetical protein
VSTNTRDRAIADAFKVATDPWKFPGLCRITRMDGSVGGIEMTPTQRILMGYFVAFANTYVDKYRQAMSSIIHIGDQLRHIQYTPGQMGMTVGDKEGTYKELMRRQGVMYNGLNPLIRTPLERPPSSEEIRFGDPHNGLIQGITGGGENPAIGFSPDYAVLSEYGLYTNYEAFDGAFFPAISRRPNAKCRIETTPGVYNSPAHEMYRQALAGKGRFQAVFLGWWRDEACAIPLPRGFEPISEEREYRKKVALFERDARGKSWWAYPENPREEVVSDGHLYFRRIALETEFHGDPRLFDAKYPPSPFEGWVVSSSPTIPVEPITEMLRTARPVPYGEEVFYEEPERGCPYLITVDGKGYGKKGDPAAITLVNMWDWREAGSFEGDEDPGQITPRILRWQRLYNADVIVETNKDGVAASLQASNCPKLHWSGAQPGWFSTEASKSAALIALVNMLRGREIEILSEPTLSQLATWDGKTRAQESGRRKHHWDRATTWLMVAYGIQTLGYQRRPKPPAPEDRRLTVGRFLASYKTVDKGRVLGQ